MEDEAIIEAINASPLNRGLDGAAWLARPGNVPIAVGDNLALFDFEDTGVYQIHVLFKSRGRLAIMAARESFRRMFEDYGAELIFGMVPDFRRDVKMLARWSGMRAIGPRATSEGVCQLFVLPRENWKGIAS